MFHILRGILMKFGDRLGPGSLITLPLQSSEFEPRGVLLVRTSRQEFLQITVEVQDESLGVDGKKFGQLEHFGAECLPAELVPPLRRTIRKLLTALSQEHLFLAPQLEFLRRNAA